MKLDNMIWQVGYAVNADPAHGIDEHQRIIAIFETLINAEQFIRNCIPQENQSRFFILNSYNNEQIFYKVILEHHTKSIHYIQSTYNKVETIYKRNETLGFPRVSSLFS